MNDSNTGIIIQARMGSTRLPGKVLMNIGPKTLLGHIITRLSYNISSAATVVVATSTETADDCIAEFCHINNINCFRGSEHDVLDRYYKCARDYSFNNIVRMTADNPFPDIAELDGMLSEHLANGVDYSHCFPTLPIGVGTEVFTFQALKESWQEGALTHHREHVNEFILEHPERFITHLHNVPKTKNRPDIRLTVDTPEDYDRANFIIDNCDNEYVSTEEAIALALKFEKLCEPK